MASESEGNFTTAESWHTLGDGAKAYTKTWTPNGPVKAHVVLVHGFTDHCNNFGYIFSYLAAAGIKVHGWDQRGWGRSVKKPSERGLAGGTKQVLDDMTSFISSLLPSKEPLFVYGHSMGGAQTLMYAATGPADVVKQIRGFVVEAPLIGLSPESKPPAALVAAGRVAAKVLPKFQMLNELDPTFLSRDPQICADYKADPLVHNYGTLVTLAGMLQRGSDLEHGKIQVQDNGNVKSIWLAHGTGDKITYAPASDKYIKEFVHIKDKTYKPYDGWYHVLHAEKDDDKRIFAQDMVEWISARLD